MRRQLSLFSSVALLSFFALTGCLRFPTNDPIAACVEQSKLVCAFAYQCCTDPDERARFNGLLFIAHRSEGECVEAYTNVCEAFGSSQRVSVERGRVEMNGDNVTACLDGLREAKDECDLEAFREAGSEDECSEIYEGTVDGGDACVSSIECKDGGSCEFEYDEDGAPKKVDDELAVAEGECLEPPGVGETCIDGYYCAEGLFCNEDDVCARPPGRGEPCPDYECAEGLGCRDPDGDFENTCEDLLPNGEPCSSFSDCQSDNCDFDTGLCAPDDFGGEPEEDLDYCEG
jgi:hypothetical protein